MKKIFLISTLALVVTAGNAHAEGFWSSLFGKHEEEKNSVKTPTDDNQLVTIGNVSNRDWHNSDSLNHWICAKNEKNLFSNEKYILHWNGDNGSVIMNINDRVVKLKSKTKTTAKSLGTYSYANNKIALKLLKRSKDCSHDGCSETWNMSIKAGKKSKNMNLICYTDSTL